MRERRVEDAKQKFEKLGLDLKDDIEEGKLKLILKDDNLIIRLAGEGSFVSGSDQVRPAFRELLGRIGSEIKTSSGKIRIEGHTDNVKIAFSDQIYEQLGFIVCSFIFRCWCFNKRCWNRIRPPYCCWIF